MKLEFRVPISPRPEFYAQLRLLAHSLRRLGAPYDRALVQVSVGEQPSHDAVLSANTWSAGMPVDWYVVPDEVHARIPGPWWASGYGRYVRPSDADVVILCDADVCPVDRFDELLFRLVSMGPAAAGLQAHYRPFADSEACWRRLLADAGLDDAAITRRYSMDVAGTHGLGPPYFNYGVVAFNNDGFRRVAQVMEDSLWQACRLLPRNPMAAQVALTFALLRTGVDPIDLGHEYNCANDACLIEHGLVDLAHIRIIHYLRNDEIDRHRFLSTPEDLGAFLAAAKANAVNERLRRHVASVHHSLFDATVEA